MITRKKASIANFNVVFLDGKSEKPLLDYIDTVVFPALNKGYIRDTDNASYRFLDVKIEKSNFGEYILKGLLVKKTVLEVKSDLDVNGELIPLDDKYSTAPYSVFVVYLKNHRMMFAENQKGSPTLQNFTSSVRFCINKYVREENILRKEKNEKLLPIPIINVTGLLLRENIENVLKDVEKINLLTLRFYPLNGDNDYTGLLGGLAKDLRQFVDSNNGEVQLKSPKNKTNIIKLLEETDGTVKPILNVTYADKKKSRITDAEISENMQIEIDTENAKEGIEQIANAGYGIKRLQNTSESNQNIYDSNIIKLEELAKKK